MTPPEDTQSYLKGIVDLLPDSPGCYQYLDQSGKIIYVGKAKNLKRRVSSYFKNDHNSLKTQMLVKQIRDIRYVVVNSEEDALLLENNLIKKHKPKYNVLLKDDKTYPSIAITQEYLPRIFQTRQRQAKGATYYGPYSHHPTMTALLELCKQLYKPRPCRIPINEDGVRDGKYEVCLDYHIHNCPGPCVGKISHEAYIENINACREILKGNTAEVAEKMKKDMLSLAAEMRFEEAQVIKEKLMLIEKFRAKSEVVSNCLHNIDVFHIESDDLIAYINYLHIVNGCITQAFTLEFKKKLAETDAELLALGIVEIRSRYSSTSPEIIVPFPVDLPETYAIQTIPQRGDKKRLLNLSRMNVKQYKFDRLKQAEKLNPEQKSVRMMKEIQKDLGLEKLPMRIELFDNSNLSGSDAVAACVVFERLKPCKKEYRKYIIKTVSGPDDYASMQEIVRRRYTRLKEENSPLPDLIIADGGRGQMSVIHKVLEEELHLQIPVAGLVKDHHHRTREILFGEPAMSVGLVPNGELFHLLTRMQDEVHRFAISFHRQKRSKRQTTSELDGIPGIGSKSKEALLKHFGSMKRIQKATVEELTGCLGKARGKSLHEELQRRALGE